MIDISTALPVVAALLHATGFILYNVQTKLGKSDPNPVSWFLGAFLATLNALSFSAMNDPIAALQLFTGLEVVSSRFSTLSSLVVSSDRLEESGS